MWPDWNGTLFWIAASSSLRAIIVAAAVAIILAVLRVRSGAVRHAAWTAVLAAMLLMPVLPGVVPPITIPLTVPGAADAVATWAGHPDEATWITSDGSVPDPSGAKSLTGRDDSSSSPTLGKQAAAGNPTYAPSRRPTGAGLPASALFVTYVAGVLFFLARVAVGWLAMRRVARTSTPCSEDGDAHGGDAILVGGLAASARVIVRESPLVSAPLTAGIVSGTVILPSTWRTWPEDELRAVLAHEAAHVSRHDTLVAFAAHVNRAIFWFHPLAWWLVGTLATNAEDACDDAAVRVVAAPGRYAEVLLDIAEAVRRRGGRIAWQGVGVDGTGLLGQRINRILRGEFVHGVSMTRKFVVGVSCVAAVILVVACRQAPPVPAPLEPNPEVTTRIEEQRVSTALYNTAKAMTLQQVADLETVLQQNAEDAEARHRLGIFYRFSDSKAIEWNERVAARRRHILWLTEHHPGDDATLEWGTIRPVLDPAGYAQARRLWLAHTSKADAPVPVLSNAAYFFEATDKPLAEQLLLRLEATAPGGPKPRVRGNVYHRAWSARLGELYVSAIMGLAEDPSAGGRVKSSLEQARRPFAIEARKKLDATRDAAVVMGAADALWNLEQGRIQTDLNLRALTTAYLERALQLDPQASRLRWVTEARRVSDRNQALYEKLEGVPRQKQAEIVSALPDAERITILPSRTDSEYMYAEYLEYVKHDPAAARVSWDQTRKYADDLLQLSGRLPDDPGRGVAIFSGHAALAALALQDNDTPAAVRHLDEAVKAPPCDGLKHGFSGLWQRVAVGLLKRGERESVAQFLDRYARLNEIQRDQLTASAAAIRAGRMPDFYQYQVTSH